MRVRERDDLTIVRRVGQDLLITRHGRVEHDLAGGDARGAYGRAAKYGSILEYEDGGRAR
jgi:hypothetical protein